MAIETSTGARARAHRRVPLLVIALLSVVVVACLAGCGTDGNTANGPLVAARVNDADISLDDFQLVVAAITSVNALRGQAANFDWRTQDGRASLAQVQKSALDYLIEAELIHQQVVKQHISVSQKDIAAAEKKSAANVADTVKQYRGNPLGEAYRKAFNARLLHILAVTDTEHNAFVAHGKIPAAHVSVLVLKGASKDVEAQADALAKQAKAGADFGKLVHQYSQDPQSSAQNGDLGTVYAGAFSSQFDTKLFTTTDEYVKVTTQSATYLFQMTERAEKPLGEIADAQAKSNDVDQWVKDVVETQQANNIHQYVELASQTAQPQQ